MVVRIGGSDSITVTCADGNLANGSFGDGEGISFVSDLVNFNNYGTTAPYTCTVTSQLSFLSESSDEVRVAVVVNFTDCTLPGDDDTEDCDGIYRGTAERVG
jgi:hypothetical protein